MITSISARNFKSFRKAKLRLGRLTAIVGANAAGKSNCRDALRFLHGVGLGYSLAEILGGKFGPGGISQWTGIRGGPREAAFHGQQRFRLALNLAGTGGSRLFYRLAVDVSDERLGPRIVSEALKKNDEELFSSSPKDDPVTQSGQHEIKVRLPRGGRYRKHGKLLAFASHTPVLSQLPNREKEKAEIRRACEEILDALKDMRFLDLDPDAMRESSPRARPFSGTVARTSRRSCRRSATILGERRRSSAGSAA